MAQKNNTDDFHDSDLEDVYDLYNACNGVLHKGLLDIRKLDELSQGESAALNIVRLRDIWQHTATGCMRCENIITTLNSVRGLLGECVEAEAVDEQDYLAEAGVPTILEGREGEGSNWPA